MYDKYDLNYLPRFKGDDDKPKSLLEKMYPMCACGVLPDWYCKLWDDRPISRCVKDISEEA